MPLTKERKSELIAEYGESYVVTVRIPREEEQ